MALVLVVQFDKEQLRLLTTLSVDLLQALEGLLDRLEQMQGGDKPVAGDVWVPGSIDLQALVAELEAMSPSQRQALADGCTPSRSWVDVEDVGDVPASLYADTLVDIPKRRRSLPRYRLSSDPRDIVKDLTMSNPELREGVSPQSVGRTSVSPQDTPVPRYRSLAQKISALKQALHLEETSP